MQEDERKGLVTITGKSGRDITPKILAHILDNFIHDTEIFNQEIDVFNTSDNITHGIQHYFKLSDHDPDLCMTTFTPDTFDMFDLRKALRLNDMVSVSVASFSHEDERLDRVGISSFRDAEGLIYLSFWVYDDDNIPKLDDLADRITLFMNEK